MHELPAESVVDAVPARTADQRVSVVRLRVGRLAGAKRDSLGFCFELANAGPPLPGATLEIEQPEARLRRGGPRPPRRPASRGLGRA